MAPGLPAVTAIMPVRNDAAYLAAAVESVVSQSYDGQLDLVIAVAPSDDKSEGEAEALAANHERVRMVPNPSGGTAAGLNAALASATGDIIVRVDAHCELAPTYVATAAASLRQHSAANVGGVQAATGATRFECAVASAMTSRFGVGDAKFHYGGTPGPVDTVYLGVFEAEALRSVGGFDESLKRNQDYELNWRLREAGHTIWFDPELRVTYRPRGTLRSLARQYFEYGQWKREVIRRHPRSLKARQAIAPLTVVGLAVGFAGAATGRRWMFAAPLTYAAAVLAGAAQAARSGGQFARLVAVFPAMHLSWGAGFLVGPASVDGEPPLGAATRPHWGGHD